MHSVTIIANIRKSILAPLALAAAAVAAPVGNGSAFAMLALPQGDFGETDQNDADAGLAELGFGAGLEYNYPVSGDLLFWSSSAWFIFNPTDDDAVKSKLTNVEDVEGGNWLNFPLLTGFKVQKDISPVLGLYGVGQLGLNIETLTEVEWSNATSKATLESDPATAFAFALGGGIAINKKIGVGIRFLNLGEPKLKQKLKLNNTTTPTSNKQSTTILGLLIGFNF